MPPQLVLASTSPRRSRLLTEAGIAFVLGEPGPEPEAAGSPRDKALLRARSKALGGRGPAGVTAPLLGVDTVVDLDGQELGKAADPAAAAAMLRRLSGRMHRVHTGHCLFDPATGARREEVATARVAFAPIDDGALQRYLDSGEWCGKAGAYGIQDPSQSFVSLVDGALDAVIGLHVDAVRRLLGAGAR
ncbi:MAG: nucleoside triphosphate pyrophosphatase [Planctomycetota bacterium]